MKCPHLTKMESDDLFFTLLEDNDESTPVTKWCARHGHTDFFANENMQEVLSWVYGKRRELYGH